MINVVVYNEPLSYGMGYHGWFFQFHVDIDRFPTIVALSFDINLIAS